MDDSSSDEECLISFSDSIENDVFSLSESEFELLQKAVTKRFNQEKYGFTTLDEAAEHYGRKIVCPNCGSTNVVCNGHTPAQKQKYVCKDCDQEFIALTKSIFNTTKKDFDTWVKYIELMIYYPSLKLEEFICDISHRTAFLWRYKIFETVDGYQNHLKLKDRIWIDETYVFDSDVLHSDDFRSLRGLSKNQLCIAVAIDVHKNMIAIRCGKGKPSYRRLRKALADHIESGSVIVHDGEHAHIKLIEELDCVSEVYQANTKDPKYLKNMALVNNLCSWLKRYLYRFNGMKMVNLQSYLSWFVYLFRVKRDNERYPQTERVLRHLILSDARFTRD